MDVTQPRYVTKFIQEVRKEKRYQTGNMTSSSPNFITNSQEGVP
jgi:hypothetical protein